MKGKMLFMTALFACAGLAGAQAFNMSPDQMTAAQKKTYSDKAKAFTGKPCAQFVMFSSMPGGTAATYNAGVKAMTGYQSQQGIKTLKKNQTGTVYQQHAQQGGKQQYIYSAFAGGTTTTLTCVLK